MHIGKEIGNLVVVKYLCRIVVIIKVPINQSLDSSLTRAHNLVYICLGKIGVVRCQCSYKTSVRGHCTVLKWLPEALIDMSLLRIECLKKDWFEYPTVFFIVCTEVFFKGFLPRFIFITPSYTG